MTDLVKFVYVENIANFNPNNISKSNIVFIKDTRQIYTQGQYYSWTAEELQSLFGDKITALEDMVDEIKASLNTKVPSAAVADSVIVNNNDINSNYKMLFHDSNNIYSTAGVYCNPSSDSLFASSFYETSDANLKTNIQSLIDSDNCPIIKQFNWKSDNNKSYGLIAQELEEQGYSELVHTDEEGFKTVNYSAALSLIVGKLQLEISELKKQINDLKN